MPETAIDTMSTLEGNLYETLGVPRLATYAEIKDAFRRLAKQHHPDKGGDEEKFREVQEAFHVLSDNDRRARYDEFGTSDTKEQLERLSKFSGALCNVANDDHVIQPLAELQEILLKLRRGKKRAEKKRDEVRKDSDVLMLHEDRPKMESAVLAVESMYRAFCDTVRIFGEQIEQCTDLIIQYRVAANAVGRTSCVVEVTEDGGPMVPDAPL